MRSPGPDAHYIENRPLAPYKKVSEELAARQPDLNLVALAEMPPFNSFFADEAGRLFVMTYEPGPGKDEFIHDVFDPAGVFVARLSLGKYDILGRSLNPLRASARNGKLYRIHRNEAGFAEVLVDRLLWE